MISIPEVQFTVYSFRPLIPDRSSDIPPLTMDLMPILDADGNVKSKAEHYKQRRRHDRFNGMSEDEVRLRTLPDHLTSNLDVVIVCFFFFN